MASLQGNRELWKLISEGKGAQLRIKVQDGKATIIMGNPVAIPQSIQSKDIILRHVPITSSPQVQSIVHRGINPQALVPGGIAHQALVPGGIDRQALVPRGIDHQALLPGGTDRQALVPGGIDGHEINLADSDDELDGVSTTTGENLLCAECGILFSTKEELAKHESTHFGEVNYICDQCGKEFGTKKFLDTHLLMHASEKKFECDCCHKKFNYRDNLIFHMRIHSENRQYQCEFCHKVFGNKSLRNNHILKHLMKNKEKPYIIPPSGSHKVGSISTDLSDGSIPKDDVVLVYPDYLCHMCPKRFGDKGSLEKHKADAHVEFPFPCDVCQKAFPDKPSLETHKVVHIQHERGPHMQRKRPRKKPETMNSKHVCPKCGKVFNRESSCKLHMIMCGTPSENKILNENSVTCAFCKKNYIAPSIPKDDHSNGMKFICESCCTLLAQKSQVSGFTPRLENRFLCSKCDRCFSNEKDLVDHINSHVPERSMCNKCGQFCSDEKSLATHLEDHLIKEKENSKKSFVDEFLTELPITSGEDLVKKSKRRKRGQASLDNERSLKDTDNKVTPSTSSQETMSSCSSQKKKKHNSDLGVQDCVSANMGMPDSDYVIGMQDDCASFPIKQEIEEDDLEEQELDMLENCTVFNAAIPKEEPQSTYILPDKHIKQEVDDDTETLIVKQEKLDEEEVTIKEEESFEFFGCQIKEEKPDETDFMMQDEFEFTPCGIDIKKEEQF